MHVHHELGNKLRQLHRISSVMATERLDWKLLDPERGNEALLSVLFGDLEPVMTARRALYIVYK